MSLILILFDKYIYNTYVVIFIEILFGLVLLFYFLIIIIFFYKKIVRNKSLRSSSDDQFINVNEVRVFSQYLRDYLFKALILSAYIYILKSIFIYYFFNPIVINQFDYTLKFIDLILSNYSINIYPYFFIFFLILEKLAININRFPKTIYFLLIIVFIVAFVFIVSYISDLLLIFRLLKLLLIN